MDIQDLSDDMDGTRDFKFHVPLSLHLRLHEHRLLTGRSISDTVSKALEAHFDEVLGPQIQ